MDWAVICDCVLVKIMVSRHLTIDYYPCTICSVKWLNANLAKTLWMYEIKNKKQLISLVTYGACVCIERSDLIYFKMIHGMIWCYLLKRLVHTKKKQRTSKCESIEMVYHQSEIKFPFKRMVCPVFLMNYCPIIPRMNLRCNIQVLVNFNLRRVKSERSTWSNIKLKDGWSISFLFNINNTLSNHSI